MKMRVKLTFVYETSSDWYEPETTPVEMAEIDQGNLMNDPRALLEVLDSPDVQIIDLTVHPLGEE